MLQFLAPFVIISLLVSCESLTGAQQNADKFCNCARDISKILNRTDSIEYLNFEAYNTELSNQTTKMQDCLTDKKYIETSIVVDSLTTANAINYNKEYISHLKNNCPDVVIAFNL